MAVAIDLPSNSLFATNISDEIEEKIGSLWDVKEVKVTFNDAL